MWADEVIVQDCSSTDRTVEIAREYTDKVFVVPNNPTMPNVSFNKSFERASCEWILSLSHDERVSPELRDEINALLANQPACTGYQMPRRNLMLGRWIQYGVFAPQMAMQLRFFRNGKGKYACVDIHEGLTVDGTVGKLKGELLHDHVRTAGDYLLRAIHYSTNEGEMYLKKVNGHLEWSDLILVPARYFALSFFVQRGYRDGIAGLAISLLAAMEQLAAVLRAWDLANHWAEIQQAEPDSIRFRNTVMVDLIETFGGLLRACVGTTQPAEVIRKCLKKFTGSEDG